MKRLSVIGLSSALLFVAAGCVSHPSIQGRARVVSWDEHRVVRFCGSGKSYELGVSTSNAVMGLGAVGRAVDESAGAPVYVELVGFRETSISGEPSPHVEGTEATMSVGDIRPAAPRGDGC